MFLNLINNNDKFMDALTDLKNCGSDCVVHVIGYSSGNDLNMMNTLKTLKSIFIIL